jgi:hypothetical protein
MLRDPKIIRKLRLKLNLTEDTTFQKAIAFHALSFNQNNVPSDFIFFVAKDKNEISKYFGQRVTNSVKNIL